MQENFFKKKNPPKNGKQNFEREKVGDNILFVGKLYIEWER